jgi:hypothetical protein
MRDPNRTAIARQKRILPAWLLPHLTLLHLIEFLRTLNTAPVHYLSLELLETSHFAKSPTPKKIFLQQTHTLLGRANQLKISCKSTIAAIDQTHKNPPNTTQILQNPLQIVVRSNYETKKLSTPHHIASRIAFLPRRHSRHGRHHHRSNKLPPLSGKKKKKKNTKPTILIDFRHRDGVEASSEDLSHNYWSIIIIVVIFALVGWVNQIWLRPDCTSHGKIRQKIQ